MRKPFVAAVLSSLDQDWLDPGPPESAERLTENLLERNPGVTVYHTDDSTPSEPRGQFATLAAALRGAPHGIYDVITDAADRVLAYARSDVPEWYLTSKGAGFLAAEQRGQTDAHLEASDPVTLRDIEVARDLETCLDPGRRTPVPPMPAAEDVTTKEAS